MRPSRRPGTERNRRRVPVVLRAGDGANLAPVAGPLADSLGGTVVNLTAVYATPSSAPSPSDDDATLMPLSAP